MNGLQIEAARAAGVIRNTSNHVLSTMANYLCPHTLRVRLGGLEQGAASRAIPDGRGFFYVREAARMTRSMVGRVGRAQALPVLVRSANPARPTTPLGGVAVGSDLSQGATMADPRNTGANAAVLPSLVSIDGTSNATISVGVNPMLVSLTLSESRLDRWHFNQDMPPSAARELASALLAIADAVEGVQS